MARVKRRRSLRGLGGSPEHHAVEMSVARRGAIRYFKSASAAAERGTCSTAFSQMAAAFALDGVADAHGGEARFPSDRNLLDKVKASTAAQAAFKMNCMKGGANLSGRRRK